MLYSFTVFVILFCYIMLISKIFNLLHIQHILHDSITFYFTGQFFEFKFPYENFRVLSF